MYKGGRIVFGLLVFVVVVTFPIFYNMGKANARPEIDLNPPTSQQIAGKECVEPKEYMRENHMQLLLQWRDSAVREGKTVYINSQGKAFDISLEDTCIKCHNEISASNSASSSSSASNTALSHASASNVSQSSDDQFCYSCHNYVAATPNCWSCHSEPKGATK